MNNLFLFVPFLVKLSESERRALIILAVVVAFVFVLIGLLVRLLTNWMDRQGRMVDTYMSDLVAHQIIPNPLTFHRYVFRRESKTLYLGLRWLMRIMILAFAGLALYFYALRGLDFHAPLTILRDLQLELTWPTETFFGIQLIADWPTITREPVVHLTVDGYVTYVTLVIAVWCVLNWMRQTLIFIARLNRSRQVAVSAFHKDLGPAKASLDPEVKS